MCTCIVYMCTQTHTRHILEGKKSGSGDREISNYYTYSLFIYSKLWLKTE